MCGHASIPAHNYGYEITGLKLLYFSCLLIPLATLGQSSASVAALLTTRFTGSAEGKFYIKLHIMGGCRPGHTRAATRAYTGPTMVLSQ